MNSAKALFAILLLGFSASSLGGIIKYDISVSGTTDGYVVFEHEPSDPDGIYNTSELVDFVLYSHTGLMFNTANSVNMSGLYNFDNTTDGGLSITSIDFIFDTLDFNGQATFSYDFIHMSTSSFTVTIQDFDDSSNNVQRDHFFQISRGIDVTSQYSAPNDGNVSVPEPSVIALLSSGLFGLGFSHRRKKKAQY
jgi:hypothetical protein